MKYLVSAFIIFLVLAALAEVKRQEWLDAHCKVIGEMSSSVGVGTGVTSGGNVATTSVYIPGKTGYQCDDDKIYWE